MVRKFLLPLLAIVGVTGAIWLTVNQAKPVPAAAPVADPSEPPYASYVSGAGIIEAATENIAIGTNVSGVVTEVLVQPGCRVHAGDPLFRLDDRQLQGELAVRQTALRVAQAEVARLEALPRPEDVPVAEAQVREAEAALADARHQLALYESVSDKRAVSQDELNRRKYAAQVAEAKLAAANASLALLRAGTWKPDIEIARSQVAAAEAQVRAVQIDLDRLTVRAPMDGEVLQVKVRVGEFAPAGVVSTPLILFGSLAKWHVRVDVDENDAWRVRPEAPATAYVRGNRDLETPLTYVRIEPYVVPKRSLTGDATERVDTRVLQIIYAFDRGRMPVYVGQQMDVYIEAPPLRPASAPTSKPRDRGAEGGRP